MNRLKTDHLGGVSFEWDDWKWEQDGVREAFFGLLTAWGVDPADSFIISGCESTVNAPNFDIAAGFIALNGEIFKVDTHSVLQALGGGDTHFWDPVVSFDPAGLEATKNLGTVNTYEIRRAKVTNGVIPLPTFMPMLADRINKKIADSVKPFFGEWIRIDLNGNTNNFNQNDSIDGTGNNIALIDPPQAGSYLKYKITGKTVEVIFNIEDLKTTDHTVSIAASMVFRNLPFTFKSGETQKFIHIAKANGFLGAWSTAGEIETIPGQSGFSCKLSTLHGSAASFNNGYAFIGSTSFSIAATATVVEVVWKLSGGFTAEIN